MNKPELRMARAESYLRIQRADVFEKIYDREDYKNSGPGESTLFRKRLPMKRQEKKTAETCGELVAYHLEDFNKGFPHGFTDYQTYDERRERNYAENNEKFKLRK